VAETFAPPVRSDPEDLRTRSLGSRIAGPASNSKRMAPGGATEVR